MRLKKRIASVILLLIILSSCAYEENIFQESPSGASDKVTKVTLDGITVQDTLIFNYEEDKIASVNWCTYMAGASAGCLVGYSEIRRYNNIGKLDSVGGRWHVSYVYENGLRKKMTAFFDNQYHSTTTFLEYTGIYPSKIKVEFASAEVKIVDLTFNASGDLTRKSIKNDNGVLLEDVSVEYTNIENPLHGMIETPAYAVLFFGFDDFVFYHSKHVPETIITDYTHENPVYPKNITIHYSPVVNASGNLVSAKAFRAVDDRRYDMHSIFISYDK